MTLAELQQLIRAMYGDKDGRRGRDGTFMWFMEEVGELAAACVATIITENWPPSSRTCWPGWPPWRTLLA